MSRRRERAAPAVTVISWRDIPAQVVAKSGTRSHKAELSPRFQVAIDRAAMAAGLAGSDAYVQEWRRASQPCGEDLEAAVRAEVERLESRFPGPVLGAYVANGGIAPGDGEAQHTRPERARP